jgi:UDP-glucose 4-epimerase
MRVREGASILVTGATGYLGRAVVSALSARGYSVTATGRRSSPTGLPTDVEYVSADLTDPASVRVFQPWRWDAIVHSAGIAPKTELDWQDNVAMITTHVRSAVNLCASVPDGWPGRLVHASGFIVYGLPETIPVGETHARRPLHGYALAKVLAEDIILLSRSCVSDRWVLRLPGIFSENRRSGGLFRFAAAARHGEDIVIDTTSATPWDVIHLDDAIHAIAGALTATGSDPGPVNVGYGESTDAVSVATRLTTRAATGSRVSAIGSRVQPFRMDVQRMLTLMGALPCTLDERLDGMLYPEST